MIDWTTYDLFHHNLGTYHIDAYSVMAYAQWVIIIINNVGSRNIKLQNVNVSWGKVHADGERRASLCTRLMSS